MNSTYRAAVAALAFGVLVAQPIAANAIGVGPPVVSSPTNIGALPVVWAFGFMLCAGMTLGKLDVDAAKSGKPVTHAQRRHALLECIIPFVGFWNLDHHKS